MEDTAKLMNSMPGATVQLPTTQYLLLQAFSRSSSLTYTKHIYCNTCQIYVKCLPDESASTCECGQQLTTSAKNYFVYVNLKSQLIQILEKYWDKIVHHNNTIQSDGCENVRDTYSGTFTQNVLQKNIGLLSLMVNTDGISLKKSGSSSVWPLQIICNFLPPDIRYRNENILCVAFYCNKDKPDMLKFCEPFCDEIEKLQSRGFVYRNQVFRAAVTCAVLDLPARAAFQQLTQYNGYFACGYCLHEGEQTKQGVRYTWNNECSNTRTHDHFLRAMQDVSLKNIDTKEGVKGISPAVSFNYFDMVKSFGLDYMHCVCLGVVKTMLRFWLKPSNHHDSYISSKHQEVLNKRILSIKPCTFITRLPRSLKHIGKFKASEFRSLLLFYLPVALRGILKKKYLDHFILLSSSIHKLLATKISNEDISLVEDSLNQFVKEYEEYYGKESMTMNIHLLTHIAFCVKNLGPLWTQSMFSFESNNATFSRYVKGHNDVVSELTTKYILGKSLSKKKHPISEKSNELEYKKKIKLKPNEVSALKTVIGISLDKNNLFQIYCVYKKNQERYSSVEYSSAKKTVDYVVEMKDKVVGKVKFYFEYRGRSYLLLEKYKRDNTRIQHIKEIVPTNNESVYFADEIEKKFIYVSFSSKHYITNRPNIFESD